MDWIADNYMVVLGLIALIVFAVGMIVGYASMSREAQIEKVKEWLKWAVSQAEKDLGSGTGQLKLRTVYNMFIQSFPWVARVITFSVFADMVDKALDWMDDQLKNNAKFKEYIYNESK